MRKFLLAALLSSTALISHHALAACPTPNPNASGPPFVDNCPIPAAALNAALGVTGGGGLAINSITAPVPTVILTNPANGVYISPQGSRVPYCQAEAVPFGCQSPYQNDFTAQLSLTMTTYGQAEIQENAMNIVVYDVTGRVNWWLSNTSWAAGARVISETNGNIYAQGASPCVSGVTAPTGGGGSDGTCSWTVTGGSDQTAKQGIGVSILAGPNGGDPWAIAAETDFQAGFLGNGGFGMEDDTRNASAIDPSPGNAGMHTMDALYFGGIAGTFPITNAIDIAPQQNPSGPVYATYNGIRLLGANTFKNFGILFETSGADVGMYNSAPIVPNTSEYTLAWISDGGQEPTSYDVGCVCTTAGIYVQPTSPVGIQFAGANMVVDVASSATLTQSVWADTSQATAFLTAAGHYSASVIYAVNATSPNIIQSTNFTLNGTGDVFAQSFSIGPTGGTGVSCPAGITAGTFRSILGIVTHC